MKKLLSLLFILTVAVSLSACSSGTEYFDVSGVQKTDSYEITPPEGWKSGNAATGVIAYVPSDFPDTPSYISVETSSEKIVTELKKNEETVKSQAMEALTSSYGETAKFDLFEESEIGGVKCIHTRVSYTSDSGKTVQDQYSADSSTGSVIVTFVNIGDKDFSKEFKACLDSVVIK